MGLAFGAIIEYIWLLGPVSGSASGHIRLSTCFAGKELLSQAPR